MVDRKEEREKASERRFVGGALGFGSSFAVGMAIFSLSGHWIDVKYDKEAIFTLSGVFMGFFYGAWEIWKLVAESNRSAVENDEKEALSEENEAE